MFIPTQLVVLLAAALSVAAMPSHIARNLHNHREIAARVAQPVPVAEVVARDIAVPSKRLLRKRGGNGRCKPVSSSLVPSSTGDLGPSSSPAPPQPTPVKGNLGGPPPQDQNTPPSESPEASTPADPATPTPTPSPTPTPDVQPDPATTPPSTPAPTPDSGNGNSGNGGGGGQIHTGQGTFYATGLGACGITNNDGQDIAAVSHTFFDSFPGYTSGNPNQNPMCGKTAKVTFEGKTVFVQLTDRCEGCQPDDLDFSPNAFNQLADPSAGRISGIQWQIIN